jgi:hypothetical protein
MLRMGLELHEPYCAPLSTELGTKDTVYRRALHNCQRMWLVSSSIVPHWCTQIPSGARREITGSELQQAHELTIINGVMEVSTLFSYILVFR